MSFDIEKQRLQIHAWFRYFMVIGNSLCDLEEGTTLKVGDVEYEVPTAATNGQTIILNPEFMGSLSRGQQNFVTCRMILAVARRQHLMRFNRDVKLWNIACEQFCLHEMSEYHQYLVDNNHTANLELPEFDLISKFKGLSEYEIYELLQEEQDEKGEGDGDGDGEAGAGTQMGAVYDGKNAQNPEARKAECQKIAQTLRSAEVQAQLAGKGSGFWARLADDAMDVGPDPESLLNRFVTNSMPTARSWRRPDPRYWQMGQYYPGEIKDNIGELVVLLDCSGSMGRDEIAELISWIYGAVQTCKPEKIHIVYFTGDVEHVDVFKWNEPFVVPEQIPSGGTNFTAAQKYLTDNGIVPKCCIWMTDGYDSFPEEPNYPVLWMMTTDINPPYGERVDFVSKKGASC